MMRHYIHSGDLGDVIYALPTIRAFGGGVLHLVDIPGMTAHGMSRDRAAAIVPLLAAQPYIHEVCYGFEPLPGDPATIPVIDLNHFRFSGQDFIRTFLPDTVLNTFGMPVSHRDEAWLTARWPIRYAPVVVARSARYRNPWFPWQRVLEKYQGHIGFVGTPAEHAAFNTEFGASVPHIQTDNLGQVCNLIAGADLFIGNQSCPLAIAHGLKMPAVVEESPHCPNCNDPRPDCWPGKDLNAFLPDLEGLSHAVSKRSPAPVDARESSADGERVGSRHAQRGQAARAQAPQAVT